MPRLLPLARVGGALQARQVEPAEDMWAQELKANRQLGRQAPAKRKDGFELPDAMFAVKSAGVLSGLSSIRTGPGMDVRFFNYSNREKIASPQQEHPNQSRMLFTLALSMLNLIEADLA